MSYGDIQNDIWSFYVFKFWLPGPTITVSYLPCGAWMQRRPGVLENCPSQEIVQHMANHTTTTYCINSSILVQSTLTGYNVLTCELLRCWSCRQIELQLDRASCSLLLFNYILPKNMRSIVMHSSANFVRVWHSCFTYETENRKVKVCVLVSVRLSQRLVEMTLSSHARTKFDVAQWGQDVHGPSLKNVSRISSDWKILMMHWCGCDVKCKRVKTKCDLESPVCIIH